MDESTVDIATLSKTAVGEQPAELPAPPNETIKILVGLVEQLYSLPAAALQVIRLTSDGEVDARALAAAIESDPALTTRVLAVVNSSLYALRERVIDLNQAITLLGIKPLKMLVLGLCLPRDLFDLVEAEVLSRYWHHALCKSVAAREISHRFYQGRSEDEVFIAGLLQNVGMLALVQHLGEPYVRFLKHVFSCHAGVLACEEEALGFNHLALSSELLARWNLPRSLVTHVSLSHDASKWPELGDNQKCVPPTLHLAELCARILGGQRDALPQLHQWGASYCRALPPEMGSLLYDLEGKIQPLAQALSIDMTDWPKMSTQIDAAYAALNAATKEAAPQRVDQETLNRLLRTARAQIQPSPSASREETEETTKSPATDTQSDSALLQQITDAVQSCRIKRLPVSLILIECDAYEEMLLTYGADYALQVEQVLSAIIQCAMDERCSIVEMRDARIGVVARDCDRQQALELARGVTDRTSRKTAPSNAARLPHSVSIGVAALPQAPRNFRPDDLLSAARRCLFAARQSGGGMTKSIDLI